MAVLDFPFWMRVLRYLGRYDVVYESQVAKDLNITYSHIVKIMSMLKVDSLITFRLDGRTKYISLTVKGKLLAELVDKVMTNRNVPVKVQRDA